MNIKSAKRPATHDQVRAFLRLNVPPVGDSTNVRSQIHFPPRSLTDSLGRAK
jgi:hypothetical protein